MMPRKRLFQRTKSKVNGEISLQITSMADVFTILLVFLLKGVATDAIQITPANATTLPAASRAQNLAEPALQIEITKTDLLVEKEKVIGLDELRQELRGTTPVSALFQRIELERARQKLIAQSNDTVKIDSRAIILADQSIPYSLIKPVLRTLAAQGYSEIKFGAVKDQ